MAKPERKPDPNFEPDYDVADIDYDDTVQASHDEVSDPVAEAGGSEASAKKSPSLIAWGFFGSEWPPLFKLLSAYNKWRLR
ncbi:hypothetical protein GO988_21455 [Hymenobacter sp. HMF4947]|uniref:Uncharacterized protein n=1 Tax=Hymenobacter ginkgonis TaxID=2682976 RepID=A0A7K1TKF7_9BACT|nr:hypothetical protein [Hymenobacter ginkgonis]MVN78904.1 hypothetical protein [Hymenobacter ginkgonis]